MVNNSGDGHIEVRSFFYSSMFSNLIAFAALFAGIAVGIAQISVAWLANDTAKRQLETAALQTRLQLLNQAPNLSIEYDSIAWKISYSNTGFGPAIVTRAIFAVGDQRIVLTADQTYLERDRLFDAFVKYAIQTAVPTKDNIIVPEIRFRLVNPVQQIRAGEIEILDIDGMDDFSNEQSRLFFYNLNVEVCYTDLSRTISAKYFSGNEQTFKSEECPAVVSILN